MIKKVGIAIIINELLLVVRNRNTVKYILPGGQREEGEESLDTLRREIYEELRCELEEANIRRLAIFTDKAANHPRQRVEIELYIGQVIGEIIPSSEIEEIHWYNYLKEDSDRLSDIIKKKILPFLIKEGYLKGKNPNK